MKLVEKYRIDKEISKLEKLYLERTMGRGNENSVTARQLKRQCDQWAALPENKKKYDL